MKLANMYRFTAALICIALLAPLAVGAPQQDDDFRMMNSGELIGTTIKGSDGATIGTLSDAIVDLEDYKANHAVIELSGKHDGRLMILPSAAFSGKDKRDAVTVKFSRGDIAREDTFASDDWPNLQGTRWLRNQKSFLRDIDAVTAKGLDTKAEDSHFARLSQLTGIEVMDRNDRTLGTIEQLAVETHSGQIPFACIDLEDGDLDIDRDRALVPFDGLQINLDEEVAYTDASIDSVRQTAFNRGQMPKMNTRRQVASLYDSFDSDPWWQMHAYRQPERDGRDRQRDTDRDGDRRVTQRKGDRSHEILRGSQLIGMDVRNTDDEDLGDIQDIVLNGCQNRVSYIVLDTGWAADWVAVPFNAIEFDTKNGRATLDIAKADLKNAPALDQDNWPELAQADWIRTNRTFFKKQSERFKENPCKESIRADSDQFWARRLSELIGLEVRNNNNVDFGDIEDVFIEADRGGTVFAMVSWGGAWGVGESYSPVPWQAIDIREDEEVATVNAQRNQLRNIALNEDEFTERLEDRNFAARVHRQFDTNPWWTTTAYRPSRRVLDTAWAPRSRFSRTFDADNTQTWKGEVVSTGAFTLHKREPRGHRLKIRTDDGRLLTVYTGPRQYVEDEDIDFGYGDSVTVKGSRARINGRDVILASNVTSGDNTLKLRDNEGRPAWDVDNLDFPEEGDKRMDRRSRERRYRDMQGRMRPSRDPNRRWIEQDVWPHEYPDYARTHDDRETDMQRERDRRERDRQYRTQRDRRERDEYEVRAYRRRTRDGRGIQEPSYDYDEQYDTTPGRDRGERDYTFRDEYEGARNREARRRGRDTERFDTRGYRRRDGRGIQEPSYDYDEQYDTTPGRDRGERDYTFRDYNEDETEADRREARRRRRQEEWEDREARRREREYRRRQQEEMETREARRRRERTYRRRDDDRGIQEPSYDYDEQYDTTPGRDRGERDYTFRDEYRRRQDRQRQRERDEMDNRRQRRRRRNEFETRAYRRREAPSYDYDEMYDTTPGRDRMRNRRLNRNRTFRDNRNRERYPNYDFEYDYDDNDYEYEIEPYEDSRQRYRSD